jgi:flavorubredoxin
MAAGLLALALCHAAYVSVSESPPIKVAIVYFTQTNHTKLLAEAIGDGARSQQAQVRVKSIELALPPAGSRLHPGAAHGTQRS